MRTMLGKTSFAVMSLMAAALLGACGDDGGGGVDATPDPPPVSTVNGTAIDTFTTPQGDVQVPRDLSTMPIAALVPGPEGGFTRIAGTGTSQGTFTIPDVPDGLYYLSIDGRYFITASRNVDLGVRNYGRSTARKVTAATLTLSVDNMAAWQKDDFLELYVPDAGAAFSSVEDFAQTPLVEGATTLALTADYLSAELPMAIDSSLGDEAFLTHNISHASPEGVPYQSLGAISYLQPFSLASGGTVTATGTFEAVAQARNRAIDWRSSEFANLISTGVPGGTTSFSNTFSGYVEIDVRARYSLPVVFELKAPTNPDVLATVSYGNPFPATWKEHVRINVFGFKPYSSGGKNGNSLAGASLTASADELLAGPIRPTIGPVQSLRVAGQDGAGPLTGLPANPKITWEPPVKGLANSYLVLVVRLVPDSMRLNRVTVGRISTTETSAFLPDGILKAGEPHYVVVRALSHPSVTFDRFPFTNSYPLATADRITTVFTP
jgi:hypothetical protein